jgi:hypothetical protein
VGATVANEAVFKWSVTGSRRVNLVVQRGSTGDGAFDVLATDKMSVVQRGDSTFG